MRLQCSVSGYLRLELFENATGSPTVVFAAALRALPDELTHSLEQAGKNDDRRRSRSWPRTALTCTAVSGATMGVTGLASTASGFDAGGGAFLIVRLSFSSPSASPGSLPLSTFPLVFDRKEEAS